MDVYPALVYRIVGFHPRIYRSRGPVQIRPLGYVKQGNNIVDIAFQRRAHHEIAKRLGDRIRHRFPILVAGNAQFLKTVQEQIVLCRQKVGQKSVQSRAGVVIRSGFGDGNGRQLHQVFAKNIVLPEITAKLVNVQASVAHLQHKGMRHHSLPLCMVLHSQIIGEWHGIISQYVSLDSPAARLRIGARDAPRSFKRRSGGQTAVRPWMMTSWRPILPGTRKTGPSSLWPLNPSSVGPPGPPLRPPGYPHPHAP